MTLLDLPALANAASPVDLITVQLWRSWQDRLDFQTLGRPVRELASEVKVNLSPGDWGDLQSHVSEYPFPQLPAEQRKALVLIVASLVQSTIDGSASRPTSAEVLKEILATGSTLHLTDELWRSWCVALRASAAKDRPIYELATSLDLSWPVSRESDTLNRYLHLVPREIVTLKGIGQKKLLVIVSCVAHAVRELSTSNASLPHLLGGHYDLTASTASPVEQPRSTRALLDESLSRLKHSHREVLQLRFGLSNDRPLTLQQVASHRAVTRERIRQIESAALTQLRIRLDTVKLRHSLDNDADLMWSQLATGHEVVRCDTSDTELLHRLDASHRLACSICDLRLTRYLDGIATRVDRGWYRSSVDQSVVERVLFQLEHNDGGPYPAPTEIVAQRLDTTVATIRTAVGLSDTLRPYKGYIWQGRLGNRGRRSIWLHRILASVPDRVNVDTTELVSLHNQWRPHSACSYADAEIVLSRYDHLFVPMGKGAWTAAGGVQLPSFTERDLDLSTSVDFEDETPDIGKNTIASSIAEILREYGPLRMSDITDLYCARTGDGKRGSVGPILITRGQFIRMAPGVYALYEHGSDQRAHEKGRTIIRAARDCSEYVRAIRSGEPRNTFPLWTYRMEQNWCEWAKECNEQTVYSSLLSVAEPSQWQHASPEERNKWIAAKQHDSTYSLDSDVHAAMPSGSVTLRELLAPSLLAFRRGSLGWVTINHLHSNKGNDSKGTRVSWSSGRGRRCDGAGRLAASSPRLRSSR